MTELPTSPFPELQALDEKRPVPSLGDLLQGGSGLPAPNAPLVPDPTPAPDLGVSRLPALGSTAPTAGSDPQLSLPSPARDPDEGESLRETLAALMAEDSSSTASKPSSPSDSAPRDPHTATDADLAEALRPILESSLNQRSAGPLPSLEKQLEPMLRNTVRRAIAEQLENSRQFDRIGNFDRIVWRLRALFTSRSYDDIVFDRTRRFQVEEAYLLQRGSNSLVSYASHDASRHAATRRVQSTVRMLTGKLQAPDGSLETSFELPDYRTGLVREGQHCLLVAILRGRTNALVRADLDYVLHQVEDRFGSRLDHRSEAYIHVLQPILEGCLLIQSPAPPR